MNASDRRATAVKNLVDEIMIVDRKSGARVQQNLSHADVAAKIRALVPLGRTATWRNAVERWAAGVEAPSQDITFWVLQGQIHALHAA